MKTLYGVLHYGSFGKESGMEPSKFYLFPADGPGLELRTQDGMPFTPDDLVSYANLNVEVRGEQVGDTFRVLEIRRAA